MRLSRQIDEAAGFWAEVIGEGFWELLIWFFSKPYRGVLLIAALGVWQFCSWAEMKVMHDHDEYFYAQVEQMQRRMTHK